MMPDVGNVGSHETLESQDAGKHGKDYEIEVAEFVLKRLLDRNFSDFWFTREKKGLGKFDDLVYMYEGLSGRKAFSLVQLKHISDPAKTISYDDIATDKSSYFCLPKYFNYYLESTKTIANDKDFKDAELEGLIICTNIDLESNLDLKNIFEDAHDEAQIFENTGRFCKLNLSIQDKRQIFHENYLSDVKKLATELTDYLMVNKHIDLNCLKSDDHVSMIRTYHIPLATHVIDVKKRKFWPSFLDSTLTDNLELLRFRECLFDVISDFCFSKVGMNATDIQTLLKLKRSESEELYRRVSFYHTHNSISDFLRNMNFNMKSNFGDKTKYPNDIQIMPTEQNKDEEEIDRTIDSFLSKLRFALGHDSLGQRIKSEMSANLYIRYKEKINSWYHAGAELSADKTTKIRRWVSKKKIVSDALNTSVRFQGEQVKLSQLVASNDVLEPTILMQLHCGLNVEIGKEVGNLGEIKNYYIDRTLTRARLINPEALKKIESDIFVISDHNKTPDDLENMSLISRLLHVDQDFNDEKFKLLFNKCYEKYGQRNVHWVRHHGSNLVWQNTHGSLDTLQTYFKGEESDIEQCGEFQVAENNRFAIITGEPGMGKSTLITHISESFSDTNRSQQHPDWIINILLKDADEILTNIGDSLTDEDVIDFISYFAHANHPFGRKLLRHFLHNEQRLVIFMDGFDELYADDKLEKILKLLTYFIYKTCIKKVFITSRPHFKKQLENCAGSVSFAITEITEREQIYFLTKFWSQESVQSEPKILQFTEKLIKKINSSINRNEKNFLGIPLQTYMFAVVFEQEALKENPNIPEFLPVISLFKQFVTKKYEIFLEEKFGEDIKSSRNRRKHQTEMRSYDNIHQNFALTHGGLFSKEDGEQFVSIQTANDYEIVLDIGIVYKVNELFYFNHRTFAEYFVSKKLVEVSFSLEKYSLRARETLVNIVLKPGNEFLLYLLDVQLSESYPVHCSVMKGDLSSVCGISDEDINSKDCLDRNLLYYAIQYHHLDVMCILLERNVNVNLSDLFIIKPYISYLATFNQEKKTEFLNIKRTKTISDHAKFALYVLKDQGNIPKELINAFDLRSETSAKNWELVKILVENDYSAQDLSDILNLSLKKVAPIKVINNLVKKISNDRWSCSPVPDLCNMLKYLFEQDFQDVEYLIKLYGHYMIDLIEKSRSAKGDFCFFTYVNKEYWDVKEMPGKIPLVHLFDYLDRRSKILSVIVRFFMENGASYIYSLVRKQERYCEKRTEEVLDFIVTMYLPSWGFPDSTKQWASFDLSNAESETVKKIQQMIENYDDDFNLIPNATIKDVILTLILNSMKTSNGRNLLFLFCDLKTAIETRDVKFFQECLIVADNLGWSKAVLNVCKIVDENLEALAVREGFQKITDLIVSCSREVETSQKQSSTLDSSDSCSIS